LPALAFLVAVLAALPLRVYAECREMVAHHHAAVARARASREAPPEAPPCCPQTASGPSSLQAAAFAGPPAVDPAAAQGIRLVADALRAMPIVGPMAEPPAGGRYCERSRRLLL